MNQFDEAEEEFNKKVAEEIKEQFEESEKANLIWVSPVRRLGLIRYGIFQVEGKGKELFYCITFFHREVGSEMEPEIHMLAEDDLDKLHQVIDNLMEEASNYIMKQEGRMN